MNLLTFDIEEWYIAGHERQVPKEVWPGMESRVSQNTMRILEILRNYPMKAHFFIMGWVAEKHPALVEAILKEGHGIGYHSWWHQDISTISEDEFGADLEKGLDYFKGLCGFPITSYRAPYFSMTYQSLSKYEILLRHGIEISSSVKSGIPFPHAQRIPPGEAPSSAAKPQFLSREAAFLPPKVPSSPFKIISPSGSLLELPLNRLHFAGLHLPFSSSGYFRLLPLSLIKHLIHSSDYTMSYFHPRDLDSAVPSTPHNSMFRTAINRLGTKNSILKFKHLLDEVPFEDLTSVVAFAHQNTVPEIRLV